MLPPPAPIVWMSTAGARSTWSRTAWVVVNGMRRSRTRQTSVDVPPMSRLITFRPCRAAVATRPATPPAGPDSTSRCALSSARGAGTLPPLDCITRNGAVTPDSAAAFAARCMYPPMTGRSAALMTVVAVRGYSRNSRATSLDSVTGMPGKARRKCLAEAAFVAVVEVAEQQADRHRVHVERGDFGDDTVDLGRPPAGSAPPWCWSSRSVTSMRAYRSTRSSGRSGRQAVHVWPAGLPVSHDVAEAARRQQPHRRKVAGQNRVGGHRRAVTQQADVADGHALACECVDGVRQATRRIIGRGRHLRHQHPAVIGTGHRIGEGPARVDAHGPTWSVHGDHLSG